MVPRAEPRWDTARGLAPLFSSWEFLGTMVDPERHELHEVAIFSGEEQSETLERLARSPIGDECQTCPVCRYAREYVDRRLAELAGRVFPPGENGEAAWRKLQAAVENTKSTVHKPA